MRLLPKFDGNVRNNAQKFNRKAVVTYLSISETYSFSTYFKSYVQLFGFPYAMWNATVY